MASIRLSLDDGEGTELTGFSWGRETDELVLCVAGGGGLVMPRYREFAASVAARGFFVVALNSRGFGGGVGRMERVGMETNAQDVVNVLRKLGRHRAHLVGWAGGNRVMRLVAARHGQLARSVVLLAAGGLYGPTVDAETLRRASEASSTKVSMSDEERVRLVKACMFAPSTADTRVREFVESVLRSEAEGLIPSVPPESRAQAPDREEWWGGGEAPLLVVQGLDDRMAPVENGRELKRQFGNRVKLVELREAGHMLAYEQAGACADAAVAFFTSLEPQDNGAPNQGGDC
uniref:AB hydrolase-1 domain-containing protein n=1 Tax=Chromera velia CCMP2878 TaxID=1169474 RepID=A0A0G4FGK0_9ALVE|eukprot:Cvel_16803.t1-p1 / transcript=Cvel_16803.t1 / gene=Cvel_16803 / organism=Chromera_velia_CCMP2878 / gene_product=hypothetical protein / transcript_product=hypothetical protein / location=Cvel_scaffold1312:26262-27128(+) / protein_length=289 / sequence_SO=supercontig / SO=protein_coding / is_pseudo=false